jgi:hypothetical protein
LKPGPLEYESGLLSKQTDVRSQGRRQRDYVPPKGFYRPSILGVETYKIRMCEAKTYGNEKRKKKRIHFSVNVQNFRRGLLYLEVSGLNKTVLLIRAAGKRRRVWCIG